MWPICTTLACPPLSRVWLQSFKKATCCSWQVGFSAMGEWIETKTENVQVISTTWCCCFETLNVIHSWLRSNWHLKPYFGGAPWKGSTICCAYAKSPLYSVTGRNWLTGEGHHQRMHLWTEFEGNIKPSKSSKNIKHNLPSFRRFLPSKGSSSVLLAKSGWVDD